LYEQDRKRFCWMNHCYGHLETMKAIKGLLGVRGAMDL